MYHVSFHPLLDRLYLVSQLGVASVWEGGAVGELGMLGVGSWCACISTSASGQVVGLVVWF